MAWMIVFTMWMAAVVCQIFDIVNPQEIQPLGTYTQTLIMPHDIWVEGDIAHVADEETGLQIIDVSDPLQPRWLGGRDPGLSN